MSYKLLDPILEPWAKSHDLTISTNYQDGEVRSIQIVSTLGETFQLWIDPVGADGKIKILISDNKSHRRRRLKSYQADILTLKIKLEEAYQQILNWF